MIVLTKFLVGPIVGRGQNSQSDQVTGLVVVVVVVLEVPVEWLETN
jgi:hypothetical protein